MVAPFLLLTISYQPEPHRRYQTDGVICVFTKVQNHPLPSKWSQKLDGIIQGEAQYEKPLFYIIWSNSGQDPAWSQQQQQTTEWGHMRK